VEIARDLGDTSKPRAWSKYSQDSSSFKKHLVNNVEKENRQGKKAGESKVNKVEEILGDVSIWIDIEY